MTDHPQPASQPTVRYHLALPADAAEILERLAGGASPAAIVALALRQLDIALRPPQGAA